MRLNVSAWAIRKPIPSIVLFLVLGLLGLVSFRSLPITRFPNIDIPIVSVTVTQAGAAPSELQTQVTKWVEDAVAGVKGVKHIISAITEGTSTTTVEFRLEVNTDRAVNDVKDAIAKIRMNLPRTIDEPIISRVEIAGLPIMVYGASAPAMTPEDLSWFVDDVVARQIQGLRGVGGVERLGGVAREVRVTLKPDRLLALGITAADVNRQLRLTSADMAGGRAEVGGQEQSIRTLAASSSLDTLAATSIVLPGGRKVRLDDLATLTTGPRSPHLRAPQRRAGRRLRDLAGERRQRRLGRRGGGQEDRGTRQGVSGRPLRPDRFVGHQHHRQLRIRHAQPDGGRRAGGAGGVPVPARLARDADRRGGPAALGLPDLLGDERDGLLAQRGELLAITLVTGILVDDAIVEIENIVRHMRMGKSPYRAALEGADEIGLAVIAITATLVAIFAPVSFMGGIAGQYFKQFGLTIAAAVFMSLWWPASSPR